MRPETSATASWTVGGRSVPPERQRRRKWPKSGLKVALMYAMLLLRTCREKQGVRRWGVTCFSNVLLSTCGSAAVRCWVAREMSSRASAARSSDCWIGSGFRT